MFTINKTGTAYIALSTPTDVTTHQFVIHTPGSAGNFTFFVKVGNTYEELKGISIAIGDLRPVSIDGVFTGFKVVANDFVGEYFTVFYTGY